MKWSNRCLIVPLFSMLIFACATKKESARSLSDKEFLDNLYSELADVEEMVETIPDCNSDKYYACIRLCKAIETCTLIEKKCVKKERFDKIIRVRPQFLWYDGAWRLNWFVYNLEMKGLLSYSIEMAYDEYGFADRAECSSVFDPVKIESLTNEKDPENGRIKHDAYNKICEYIRLRQSQIDNEDVSGIVKAIQNDIDEQFLQMNEKAPAIVFEGDPRVHITPFETESRRLANVVFELCRQLGMCANLEYDDDGRLSKIVITTRQGNVPLELYYEQLPY